MGDPLVVWREGKVSLTGTFKELPVYIIEILLKRALNKQANKQTIMHSTYTDI